MSAIIRYVRVDDEQMKKKSMNVILRYAIWSQKLMKGVAYDRIQLASVAVISTC